MKPRPPNEKPVFRANEKPAQTKETNNTSKVNNHPAKGKAKQPLYAVAVDLADAILNQILGDILKAAGAVAKRVKGGSR